MSLHSSAKSILAAVFSFETAFVLFLFAGRYKTDPRFAFIPVDLTALMFAVSVAAGAWVLLKRKGRLRSEAVALSLIFAAFLAYCLLSISWSPSQVYAQQKGMLLSTLTAWTFLACTHVISPDIDRVRRFFNVLLVFSVWVAAEVVYGYVQGATTGGQQLSAFGQDTGYNGLSRVIGLGVLVAFTYGLGVTQKKKRQFSAFMLAGGMLALLLLVGSRAGFVATLIPATFPIFTGISLRRGGRIRYKKYVKWVGILFGILASIVVVFSSSTTLTTIVRLVRLVSAEGGGNVRFVYWENAIELWMANPILGVGLAGWPLASGKFGDVLMYPHNFVFEILSELGGVGLLLFGGGFAFAFVRFWRNHDLRVNYEALLIVMLLVNVFLNALSTGDIPQNRIVFGMIGLLLCRFPSRLQSPFISDSRSVGAVSSPRSSE